MKSSKLNIITKTEKRVAANLKVFGSLGAKNRFSFLVASSRDSKANASQPT